MVSKLLKSLVVLMLVASPAAASAQSVGAIEKELEGVEPRIGELEQRFLKPAVLASRYKLEARYNDGRVAYFQQDYGRASVLLVDVVRNPDFKSAKSYREAVFLLGDSLFELKNFVAARRFFTEIFQAGPGPYYEESAARLLEIALYTRDFDKVDSIYQQMASGGKASPAMSYLAGKAFYAKEDYQRARESFGRSATDPEYRLQSEYFRAVTFAAEQKLDEAEQVFSGITKGANPTNAQEREIVDLAWIALGRLAYEKGDVEHAIDYYNRVPKESPQYDRMLWELTWVLVSRGNYQEARRNVDIIHFLDDPDPDIAAESQLLRADLSLRLDEYDAARADYLAVLDKFGPVAGEMNTFSAQHEDLAGFFSTMTQSELDSVEKEVMPPLVRDWVDSDPDMRNASVAMVDVRATDGQIRDASRMLDQIAAQLNSSNRVQSFPELAKGMAQARDIENRLFDLRLALLKNYFENVSGGMSGADKAAFEAKLKEIESHQAQLASSPVRQEKLAREQAALADKYDELRTQISVAGNEIASLKSQLGALNQALAGAEGQALSAEDRATAEKARDELTAELTELEGSKTALESELETLRTDSGNWSPATEQATRAAHRKMLEDAQAYLKRFGNAPNIETALARFEPLENRLDAFFGKMGGIVDQRVAELREDITVERALIDEHRQSMEELVSSSETGAGVLAYLNFIRAQKQFNEIVLRADVGLIDVTWDKKEDMTTKISELFEQRTSELKLLQESFEEVR